jgi:hypothetical protein
MTWGDPMISAILGPEPTETIEEPADAVGEFLARWKFDQMLNPQPPQPSNMVESVIIVVRRTP